MTLEYVCDTSKDVFQLGRMLMPQNDFVIRGPLHADASGVLCGPVSRWYYRGGTIVVVYYGVGTIAVVYYSGGTIAVVYYRGGTIAVVYYGVGTIAVVYYRGGTIAVVYY